METKYYKFLLPGRVTPVQKTQWPVRAGAWTPKTTPVLCESGWHASGATDLFNHLPSTDNFELWEVEGRGATVIGGDKVSFEQIKLVRLVRTFDAKFLRLFACDVAEDVLPIFESKYPKDSRPRNAIEVARRFANGEATRDELAAARAAAGDAAGDAAGAAAWDAGAAAWAAWGSAWYADRAARYVARYAARAAVDTGVARAKYSTWLVDGPSE